MTAGININDFMTRFHALERDLALFDDAVDGELWWDSVRFGVCLFMYDCLTGLTYSSAHRPAGRSRALGQLRRTLQRRALLADAALRRRDLLVVRAPRSLVGGVRRDVVLDPMVELFPERARIIDTAPRRYHLPEGEAETPGKTPPILEDVVAALFATFAIDPVHAAHLVAHIRALRARYESDVVGYHHLFDRARPHAVLMVQNGIEKALFHVANVRGVPIAEAQHGLIGFGHPNYSYARDIDYGRQTTLPTLFLTFSDFWSRAGHFPAARHEAIGTDHFAGGVASSRAGLGEVMVIAADIYHDELLALTLDLARRLPDRRLIYKLHPNQASHEPAIRAAFADRSNVAIGPASSPAARMMDDVTHVVAIQSTVVYEALQSGRRAVIVPRHDYQLHADLFDLPTVSTSADEADMAAALEIPTGVDPAPVFFERFDPARARAVLASLLEGRA